MGPLRCKVVLLGDGKVGKTCLQYSFAHGLDYLARHQGYHKTAIENYELLLPINDGEGGAGGPQAVSLALWDTAGQEECEELRRMCHLGGVMPADEAEDSEACASAGGPTALPSPLQCDVSVFILCFAWDDPHSLTSLQMRWYREIRRVEQAVGPLRNGSHGRPFTVVLCGTKFDLRTKADRRGITAGLVTREQAYTVQQSIGADALVVCSSKTGFGVRDVFHTAVLLWLQKQPAYTQRLAPATPREALTLGGGDELPRSPSNHRIAKRSCQLF
ncbi:rho-like GTP binding protein [Trypanosoma conorhini]|uniref:Rho-like GTP binding protein n=2 Tax=Trypanosoma conorhini TaxID=83891 RepID=A0A422Q8P2_9TRYP|nr:rho-like GTP binding protein [Trypanosoma conorhini]RNF26297.1 rho-like GTP binding protein [Trypanosoma conorhini]